MLPGKKRWRKRKKNAPCGRSIRSRSRSLETPAPSWSPDGKWIVYTSNESGQWEIYVAAALLASTAGAATQIVGSPTPPQNPPDGMMIDSTFGICAIRIES